MNQHSILGLAMIVFAGAAQAQAPNAYWSFDSAISPRMVPDETGHGFDLAGIQDVDSMRLIGGARGKALSLKGAGFEAIVLESTGSFNFAQGTIEAVIYHNENADAPNAQVIFSNVGFSPGISEGYYLSIWPGSLLSLSTGNDQSPGPAWSITQATEPLADKTTYHVAATINDHGFNRLFVNGELVATEAFVPYKPSRQLARVGCTYGNGYSVGHYHGAIDELKIYNQVLSTAEIRSHYAEFKPAIDSLNALPLP